MNAAKNLGESAKNGGGCALIQAATLPRVKVDYYGKICANIGNGANVAFSVVFTFSLLLTDFYEKAIHFVCASPDPANLYSLLAGYGYFLHPCLSRRQDCL